MVIMALFLICLYVGYWYYITYNSLRILLICGIFPIVIAYSVLNLQWVREDQAKNLVNSC
jgi:hypothetical protein